MHAAVAKHIFGSENNKKNCTSRSTFWSSDVEKMHAAVAKHTFGSENFKKLYFSEHFLKFRCRKIARRCGETHIWKWKFYKTVVIGALFEVQMSKKCTPLWRNTYLAVKIIKKTVLLGALFEVQMLKKCTPLWRNTHLEVKILKNCTSRSTFWSSDAAKLHAAVAKHTFGSENFKKLWSSEQFLRFGCRKISQVES